MSLTNLKCCDTSFFKLKKFFGTCKSRSIKYNILKFFYVKKTKLCFVPNIFNYL